MGKLVTLQEMEAYEQELLRAAREGRSPTLRDPREVYAETAGNVEHGFLELRNDADIQEDQDAMDEKSDYDKKAAEIQATTAVENVAAQVVAEAPGLLTNPQLASSGVNANPIAAQLSSGGTDAEVIAEAVRISEDAVRPAADAAAESVEDEDEIVAAEVTDEDDFNTELTDDGSDTTDNTGTDSNPTELTDDGSDTTDNTSTDSNPTGSVGDGTGADGPDTTTSDQGTTTAGDSTVSDDGTF